MIVACYENITKLQSEAGEYKLTSTLCLRSRYLPWVRLPPTWTVISQLRQSEVPSISQWKKATPRQTRFNWLILKNRDSWIKRRTRKTFTYITSGKFIRVCKPNSHMPTSKLVTHVYLHHNMEDTSEMVTLRWSVWIKVSWAEFTSMKRGINAGTKFGKWETVI